MGNGNKIVGVVTACGLALAGAMVSAEECREDAVIFRSDAGMARFRVEVADDKAERAQGLMNRETLSKSAGMLFVYPHPQRVGFWMKNTLIPLDMIFLDKAGVVKKVHSDAKPLDETPIMGGNDIFAVLEINGGLARKIGISEGWQMRHPSFDQDVAAWPCDG
ncbi:MAG: DUF192 domain-containing protein [Roseovarius sp.]|nr:DUF192 domain-containing protein [Roseovarius sp.]